MCIYINIHTHTLTHTYIYIRLSCMCINIFKKKKKKRCTIPRRKTESAGLHGRCVNVRETRHPERSLFSAVYVSCPSVKDRMQLDRLRASRLGKEELSFQKKKNIPAWAHSYILYYRVRSTCVCAHRRRSEKTHTQTIIFFRDPNHLAPCFPFILLDRPNS